MGDFANIINRLGEVRDILATNIAAHGVTVTEGSSISTLATRAVSYTHLTLPTNVNV